MSNIIEEIDEYKVPKAEPHNKSVIVPSFDEYFAKKVMIAPARIAPQKAKIFMEEIVVAMIIEIPKVCAITAPKVAPALIPMIPGSARGFLKYIWNELPLAASNAPEIATKIERGKRRENIIVWAKEFFCVKACINSCKDKL